jgi:putative endonuclease
MTSRSRVLYVGVTNDIEARVAQHRLGGSSFTGRYRVRELVHVEEFDDINDAIGREKEIKGWTRARKIALIDQYNPSWQDLLPSDASS